MREGASAPRPAPAPDPGLPASLEEVTAAQWRWLGLAAMGRKVPTVPESWLSRLSELLASEVCDAPD